MKPSTLWNRRSLVVLLGALILGATVAALRCNQPRIVSSRPSAGNVTIVFVASFAVRGIGTDSWSGAGLAEEVRLALAADSSVAIRRLNPAVVGAAPSPTFDADGAEEIAAARRIGADYVLTGTVGRKKVGSDVALRLIRATDASTAWTGTFWRSSTDYPSLAGDLAAAVTEAIRAEHDSEARKGALQSTPAERMPH